MTDECTHDTIITYNRGKNRSVSVCFDCGRIKVNVDGQNFETFNAFPIVLGVLRRKAIGLEKLFKFLAGGS